MRGLLLWLRADRFRALAFGFAIATAVLVVIATFRLVGGPSGSTVTGVVVKIIEEVDEGRTRYDTVISYELDGVTYQFHSAFGSASTRVGDDVTVYVDPDNPKGTNSTDSDRAVSIFSFFLSALVTGSGMWLFRYRSREGSWPAWISSWLATPKQDGPT